MNSSAVKRENISCDNQRRRRVEGEALRALPAEGATRAPENDPLNENVRRFLGGDKDAFEAIRLHLEPIVHSVVNVSRHRLFLDQVDDLRQACWIEVMQKLPFWDPSRGSLRSFMYRCISNCVASYFRQCRYFSRFIPSDNAHESLTSLPEESVRETELNLSLPTRFDTPVSRYVMHRVAIAVYLRVFERCRNGFIRDVARIAVIPSRRAAFLVDYAVVILRRHGLEQRITEEGWSRNFLNWV